MLSAFNNINKLRNDDTEKAIEEMFKDGTDRPYCRHFGCGRRLTLQESLYGDKCIKHSGEYNQTISKPVSGHLR